MTDFLSEIPDMWMLLSIVQQHPNGIGGFRLAEIALQKPATSGQVNEVRNRMMAHIDAGRVSKFSDGFGGVVYLRKQTA